MSSTDISKWLEFAKETALAGGKLAKQMSGGSVEVRRKGAVDLVTDADLAAERLVIERIRTAFPDHVILSEEAGSSGVGPYVWIIDPLDGTTNFAHGFPIYACSVALQVEGEVVAGAVYEPNLDELFWAGKSGGAYLNGKPINVSSVDYLEAALLATGFPYDLRDRPREVLDIFEKLSLVSQGMRRAGAAAVDLCFLACGRIDGFWELGLKPWDAAAAGLIVEEAGGRVTNLFGGPFDLDVPEILASNGLMHQEMLEIIRQS